MASEHGSVLSPLTAQWLSKIELSRKARKEFDEVANECMLFFCAPTGFLWDQKYKDRFKLWAGDTSSLPKFRMTIAKAFEMVALFGPVLYAQNPVRTVTPRKALEVSQDLLMAVLSEGQQQPMNPLMALQQQMMQQQVLGQMYQGMQITAQADQCRAMLLERYLNYTPNEMPGGGLAYHAERSITEALVKGRGVSWTEPMTPPGGQHVLVTSRYGSCNDLYTDPDFDNIDKGMWVAEGCLSPTWKLEEEWKLPAGSLKHVATHESAATQALKATDPFGSGDRAAGKTNDLMVTYKIYSKMGVGARLAGLNDEVARMLDQVVGQYAYLVIAPGVPYPLNLSDQFLQTASDDEIRAAASWPVPYWADDRWPCTVLDFYSRPGSSWPIAPLSPGLGELKFINTFLGHLANRIWMSSRDLIAVATSASESLKKAIRSGQDQSIIEIDSIQGSIDNMVKVLQQPETNLDVWRILQEVLEMFEKRTGLTDLLYGQTSVQMRSAEEAATKRNQVSVRPDYMAGKVETWLTEMARREGMCARWFVQPETFGLLCGPVGAFLWQKLVLEQDVEKVVRELSYRVESGSARKPNKDRDVTNANQTMSQLAPIYNHHADVTGDTAPLNNVISQLAKAIDIDPAGLQMGPRIPPMPPPMPGVPGAPPEGRPPQLAAPPAA